MKKLSVVALGVISSLLVFGAANAASNISTASVSPKIFDQVKKNENWKQAFLTGKHAQIVFMSVSPQTNPKNEIGMEKHAFDQIIFIVEGKAKVILDGKTSTAETGDVIFIPQGTEHDIINLDDKKALKVLSVYSSNDIPFNSSYKTKADNK